MRQIGNPNKQGASHEATQHGKVAVFSAGSWGTAFSHGAGRRRQRRHAVGAPRGGRASRSTSSARTPTTCRASSCRRRSRPPTTRRRPWPAPTWSCWRRRPSRCATTSSEWAPYIEHGRRDGLADEGRRARHASKRMSEVIAEVTGAGPERIAVISGPNLAMEIARREPAASVVACADEEVAKRLQARCPLAGVPALHQHRRARLRARRRLQERRRPRGRHGGRPRVRRQHHGLGDHPRAWPRPPGWRWRWAPTR